MNSGLFSAEQRISGRYSEPLSVPVLFCVSCRMVGVMLVVFLMLIEMKTSDQLKSLLIAMNTSALVSRFSESMFAAFVMEQHLHTRYIAVLSAEYQIASHTQ